MNESLSPDEQRVEIIRDLWARPGPKPLKPIPPELKAELFANMEPYEDAERGYRELMEKGGVSIDDLLEELDRRVERT